MMRPDLLTEAETAGQGVCTGTVVHVAHLPVFCRVLLVRIGGAEELPLP